MTGQGSVMCHVICAPMTVGQDDDNNNKSVATATSCCCGTVVVDANFNIRVVGGCILAHSILFGVSQHLPRCAQVLWEEAFALSERGGWTPTK